MAEVRINTTGKLSLFDADDSHAASIVAGTVTANENVMSLATAGVTFSADAIIGDDLTLSSDSAVISFGADADTTLTHTDGTGLTLNSTNKLCFNDASQFIQGSSATVLSIGATDEIDLTATAVDLNGTLDVSGVTTLNGALTTNSNAIFNEGGIDANFRIESDDNDYMFFVDGGGDHVNIGTGTDMGGLVNIAHSTSGAADIKIYSTATPDGSSQGGTINLGLGANSNAGSGVADTAAGDKLGVINFLGQGTDYTFQGAGIIAQVQTGDGNDVRANQGVRLDFYTMDTSGVAYEKRWSIDQDGNLLPASTAHGVYLGVTSATAANLLDDYEEGTWTPVIKSNANTISTSGGVTLAQYTKIGQMVSISLSIQATTTSGTIDNSGNFLRVSGLPFAAQGDSGTRFIGTQLTHYLGFKTSEENVVGLIGAGASDIEFVEHDSGDTEYSPARLESVGGNSYIQFSAVYYV